MGWRGRQLRTAELAGMLTCGLSIAAAAGQCVPELVGFSGGDVGYPTLSGPLSGAGAVNSLLAANLDGTPRLFIGGAFTAMSSLPTAFRLVSWDGAGWEVLGQPSTGGNLTSMAVFDDGSGPALHIGCDGFWASLPGYVYKWNGSSWTSPGGGVNGPVRAMGAADDGTGVALFVAGNFGTAGGQPAQRIARWNGQTWSALGSGISSSLTTPVRAIHAHDDGSGPAVYIGGPFQNVDGMPATGLARWRNGAWEVMGPLSGSGTITVNAFRTFDDGGGPAFYVGGNFTSIGGVPANHIAKWDGQGWSAMGSGAAAAIESLEVFDGGQGARLHAGGFFSGVSGPAVARWDSGAWQTMGGALPGFATTLAVFDEGRGPALFAGGASPTPFLRKWKGDGWTLAGSGMSGTVAAVTRFDDGAGDALYVAGSLRSGHDSAGGIVRIRGDESKALLPPLAPTSIVRAMRGFQGELYAGGLFLQLSPGGGSSNNFGRWDGQAWQVAGSTLSGEVWTMEEHAGMLVVGGAFSRAGSSNVAAWDGSAWHGLGTGVGAGGSRVYALRVLDDGSGPALYAAHNIGVSRWDGTQWMQFGGNTTGNVRALAVYDDGSGPRLYAGGEFQSIGGVTGSRMVAKWDGQAWSGTNFLSGSNPVMSLEVFDFGQGPRLVAAGSFLGGGPSNPPEYFAQYDGQSWSSLATLNASAHVAAVLNEPGGPALYIGGNFTAAGGASAIRLLRYGCPALPPCYANCDGSTTAPVLNVADFSCFLTKFAAGEAYANCDLSSQPPTLNVADFTCFLTKFAAGCP